MTPMICMTVTTEAAEKFVRDMEVCGWFVVREVNRSGTYVSFRDVMGKLSTDYEVIIFEEDSYIRLRPVMG